MNSSGEVKETKGKRFPCGRGEKIGTFRGGHRMASFPHRSRNSILHYEITQTFCAHGHWRRRAYASSRRIVINFVFVQSFQEFKLEKLYCDTCSRTRVSPERNSASRLRRSREAVNRKSRRLEPGIYGMKKHPSQSLACDSVAGRSEFQLFVLFFRG